MVILIEAHPEAGIGSMQSAEDRGSDDPNDVVSLQDVLEEDQELESTANAVLGDAEDAKCSYYKVHIH